MTVTSEGNSITNGETVNRTEGDDFNFTCTTSDAAVDITLNTDIDVPGSPVASTRDFYLLNVQYDLNGVVFTCTDDTDSITFTLNVLFAARYNFSQPVYMRFEGENFFTNSTVEANPEPSNVTWTRDGVILSNEDNIDITNTSITICLLYTSPSPRDRTRSRMPSSA